MLFFVLFVLQLTVLYFLSKRLIKLLFKISHKLTKNSKNAYYLLAILFLPGTFIHEVSHFLSALFLLVPVSELELIPEVKEDKVKLGSVAIGKTDPLRRFFVGIAPFLLGTSIILTILNLTLSGRFIDAWWGNLLAGYIVFQIGNTMFASKKDLEGALALSIFIVFIIAILILAGFRIPLEVIFTDKFEALFRQADLYLFVPIALDSLAIILLDNI